MAEFRSSGESHAHEAGEGSLSVPFVLLAAALCGVGLFGMSYWLVTFYWPTFLSVVPLALGAWLLFSRGTGPDRA